MNKPNAETIGVECAKCGEMIEVEVSENTPIAALENALCVVCKALVS